jgi:glycogen phosphorylase
MLDHLDVWNPYPLPPLPEAIQRLGELPYNLWWSWHPEAEAAFEALDAEAWHIAQHNPVLLLRRLPSRRLRDAAADPAYVARLNEVMAAFDAYMGAADTPVALAYPAAAGLSAAVAYFSAEFGLHQSLPIYSGGLGVLAGDHCKAASDLGLPLVAVGLLYPQGYFSQTLDEHGRQEARYDKLNRAESPLRPAMLAGEPVLVEVSIAGRPVQAQVWYVAVGRIALLLLDTDIPANWPSDREVGYKLYGGGPSDRLRQEMVLGIGGARALAALGLDPPVWHLNEGHAAFAPLERVRAQVAAGKPLQAAREQVARNTVFTTHTPVKAGHDEFSEDFIRAHFEGYPAQLGLSENDFLGLARRDQEYGPRFSMTTLAFRLSGFHNAVSWRHGEVTRAMWHDLWPGVAVEDVPVRAITNGVHRPTWQAPSIAALIDDASPPQAPGQPGAVSHRALARIPDELLWQTHRALKGRLVDGVREYERSRRVRLGRSHEQVLAVDGLLDPDALTIGFARRFATYKRATLLFHDPARLAAIVHHPERPVQFVFAGKAHPADEGGQALLAQVYAWSQHADFARRLVVVEGYDFALGQLMTRGVDLWLNTPRKPQEACGTSGMKAALNGVPNLSILDGWWIEGYSGDNGWAISGEDAGDTEATDARDADALYRLLESEVAPCFYDRDGRGLPGAWLTVMRAAIATSMPMFTAERMVAEYAHTFYIPALTAALAPAGA